MSTTFDFGDDSNSGADDIIELSFQEGANVTVKNLGPTTVSYWLQFPTDEASADGTITSGSSHTINGPGPAFLTAAGRTSVTLTDSAAGGAYGQ